MLSYGLTGGMGSGKSTVAGMLRQAGLPVFDADGMGRDLLRSNAELILTIRQRHPGCSLPDGSIDRPSLARIVFNSEKERSWLEDLMHPLILEKYERQTASMPAVLSLIEGAVLLESRTRFHLDGLVVVTAPEKVRIDRLRKRDGSSEDELRSRLDAQLPEPVKIANASHLVDNGGSLEQTRAQTRHLVRQLQSECGGWP